MAYLISFDKETGLFSAHSSLRPYVVGTGKSLFAAIDQLEVNLERDISRTDGISVNLMLEEKKEDKIELTARVSITM